ncbi:MAG: hypothetical protein COV48_02450 [Elusimicrobia bacterium CG11_big_fil_rev_8_21_14_0_20_64_6]|nr:MAG: hypothetical protein COV48_02450 [Elusimicrobia bacterium CG11_big_fil_rev_8_21_14_0_20_64_6]
MALLTAPAAAAAATSPRMMDFQGKLLDASGNPRHGSFSIAFSLFAAASGGAALWSETQPSVAVDHGRFSVKLGTVAALSTGVFNRAEVYLELQAGAEAAMAPRQPVLMTPYAFRVLLADDLAPGGTNYVQVSTALQSGAVFHVASGTVAGPFMATGPSSFTALGNAVFSLTTSSGVRLLNGSLMVEGAGGLRVDGVVSADTVAPSDGLLLPQGPGPSSEGSLRWDPAQNLVHIGTSTSFVTLADTVSTQTATNKTLNSTGGNLVDATHLRTRVLSSVAPVNGMTIKWSAADSRWHPVYLSTISVATHNFAPKKVKQLTANLVYLVPMEIPGTLLLNEIRISVAGSSAGSSGDVGLYATSGNLIASGGTGSASTGSTGLKIIPVQGAPVIVYPGQYFAAFTSNGAPRLPLADLGNSSRGVIKGLGYATETGGTTLPATINIAAIIDFDVAPSMGFNK